jgi:hypothetical protein
MERREGKHYLPSISKKQKKKKVIKKRNFSPQSVEFASFSNAKILRDALLLTKQSSFCSLLRRNAFAKQNDQKKIKKKKKSKKKNQKKKKKKKKKKNQNKQKKSTFSDSVRDVVHSERERGVQIVPVHIDDFQSVLLKVQRRFCSSRTISKRSKQSKAHSHKSL